MLNVGYTRWDPKSRAGAVGVRKKRAHDALALEAISDSLAAWADHHEVQGECDFVETSPIRGEYDWRSYLREETQLAREREEAARPREKKASGPRPPRNPPSGFYA